MSSLYSAVVVTRLRLRVRILVLGLCWLESGIRFGLRFGLEFKVMAKP